MEKEHYFPEDVVENAHLFLKYQNVKPFSMASQMQLPIKSFIPDTEKDEDYFYVSQSPPDYDVDYMTLYDEFQDDSADEQPVKSFMDDNKKISQCVGGDTISGTNNKEFHANKVILSTRSVSAQRNNNNMCCCGSNKNQNQPVDKTTDSKPSAIAPSSRSTIKIKNVTADVEEFEHSANAMRENDTEDQSNEVSGDGVKLSLTQTSSAPGSATEQQSTRSKPSIGSTRGSTLMSGTLEMRQKKSSSSHQKLSTVSDKSIEEKIDEDLNKNGPVYGHLKQVDQSISQDSLNTASPAPSTASPNSGIGDEQSRLFTSRTIDVCVSTTSKYLETTAGSTLVTDFNDAKESSNFLSSDYQLLSGAGHRNKASVLLTALNEPSDRADHQLMKNKLQECLLKRASAAKIEAQHKFSS